MKQTKHVTKFDIKSDELITWRKKEIKTIRLKLLITLAVTLLLTFIFYKIFPKYLLWIIIIECAIMTYVINQLRSQQANINKYVSDQLKLLERLETTEEMKNWNERRN